MFVVFDIGNVLIGWNPRNLFRKVMDELRMEQLLSTALSMDFVRHTDVAASFADTVEERAAAYPEFAEALQLFHRRWLETLGRAGRSECRAAPPPSRRNAAGLCAEQLRRRDLRHRRRLASFPQGVRRPRHFGSRRRRQTRSAHLRDSVRACRATRRKSCCSSTTRSPTSAPRKRSACRRSTSRRASILRRSLRRAAR